MNSEYLNLCCYDILPFLLFRTQTHTMLGNDQEAGCMALTLQDLFEAVERSTTTQVCTII